MGIRRVCLCGALAGLVQLLVGTGFHVATPILCPDLPAQYSNVALFRPWEGWTSTYMLLHPMGFGIVFAAGFLKLQSRGSFPGRFLGGLAYGFGIFIVGSLPVFLLTFASFQVSAQLIAAWIAQNACQYIAAGAAIGWFSNSAETESSNASVIAAAGTKRGSE